MAALMVGLDVNRPLTVLVVEDVQIVREAIKSMLCKDCGITVLSCGTLKEAIKIVANQKIDAAVLDLTLPDAENIHALTELQEHVPSIPVVVLTGHKDHELEAQVMEKGAQDFLTKPQTAGTLITAVRHAVIRNDLAERRFEEARISLVKTKEEIERFDILKEQAKQEAPSGFEMSTTAQLDTTGPNTTNPEGSSLEGGK
jgi:DNA-binding NtrC family response regulator